MDDSAPDPLLDHILDHLGLPGADLRHTAQATFNAAARRAEATDPIPGDADPLVEAEKTRPGLLAGIQAWCDQKLAGLREEEVRETEDLKGRVRHAVALAAAVDKDKAATDLFFRGESLIEAESRRQLMAALDGAIGMLSAFAAASLEKESGKYPGAIDIPKRG